jgi:cardiolipin synthase
MAALFETYWPWITSAALVIAAVWATGHAVLQKRDQRAVVGWVGLIWFAPLFGVLLYFLFGINRIQRRAKRLKRKKQRSPAPVTPDSHEPHPHEGKLRQLARLNYRLTGRPVWTGNRVQPFFTGEAAYSAMLDAIAAAKQSVALSTYIFDNHQAGKVFADALSAAVVRGVEVRVLVDAIGARYSFPSIVGRLRRGGVPTARFMPSLLPWHFAYAQLRNHRKILVIDGTVGFTGGMNIRDGHDLRTNPRMPILDFHARLDGPVVADLRAVFAADWEFTTGEELKGARWNPPLEPAGTVDARGISSGPDDDLEKLRTTYFGALACARRSVRVMTPYFLPDSGLVTALGVAALRGVRVDILVPEQNNLRLVHWAMMGQIGQVLEHGCHVWLTPLPFDHSKLLIVDDEWCLFGSANWDPRSLRLNFEFDVECYDKPLVAQLIELCDRKQKVSRPLTTADLNRRNLFQKLRDGVVRLASPYL